MPMFVGECDVCRRQPDLEEGKRKCGADVDECTFREMVKPHVSCEYGDSDAYRQQKTRDNTNNLLANIIVRSHKHSQ